MKNHYQKAADEIIEAMKDLIDFCINNPQKENPFSYINIRKGKKLVIEMLKANFKPIKRKWK